MRRGEESVIRRYLEPGERVLWAGSPQQGIIFRSFDLVLVPFSLMWGGFAIFWEIQVFRMGAPLFMALFGIPFVVIGLYIIFGRFLVDAYSRANTVYAITDTRAVIVAGLRAKRVTTYPLATLDQILLTERPDGFGTVALGQAAPFLAMARGSGWPGLGFMQAPCFERVPDAKRVHDLLLEARAAARA